MQARELVQLQSDAVRQKKWIAELDSVVAANPERVDQAELLSLRSCKAAVEEYIDAQNHSLTEPAKAVPKPLSRFEEVAKRVKEAIRGNINNK